MPAFNKFYSFVEARNEGAHNLGSDTIKIALTNSAPVATNTILANITDIASGGGYTAGGVAVTRVSSSQTLGVYRLVLQDLTLNGPFGPFRYAVLFNDTAAGKPLIGYYDYGAALTITSGNNFTMDFDGTNGVLSDT